MVALNVCILFLRYLIRHFKHGVNLLREDLVEEILTVFLAIAEVTEAIDIDLSDSFPSGVFI